MSRLGATESADAAADANSVHAQDGVKQQPELKQEDDDYLDENGKQDDLDDDDDDPILRRGRKRKATEEPEDDDDEQEEDDDDEDDMDAFKDDKKHDGVRRKSKKKGRKHKSARSEELPDEKALDMDVRNDEVYIENEDPKGVEKIDELGFLKGNRKFKVKTFTLLGKGQRQYMVSTEPARLVGFRDSYLLFKTHTSLFKKVCTIEEKMDLIDRHLIPTSYKGRAVNLVTARSIFREFGARMIVGGKKVTDDFWEQQARDRGDVEGEFADPEEASTGTGPTDPYLVQVQGSALINYQSDHTWMAQVVSQVVELNTQYKDLRAQTWTRGIRDSYTGLNFFPTASQPTRAVLRKISQGEDDEEMLCSIKFYNPDIRRKVTGLATIPKSVFEDLEDEEIKQAILEQQAYERRWQAEL